MRDFTLRAPDEAAMLTALVAAGMTALDDNGVHQPRDAGDGWALDIVGDYHGGYWANLRYDDDLAILPLALEFYVTSPPPGFRQWAR